MKRNVRRKRRPDDVSIVDWVCASKVRYLTEGLAVMGAKRHLFRKPELKEMWTYPCEFCSGWHITSRFSDYTCVTL